MEVQPRRNSPSHVKSPEKDTIGFISGSIGLFTEDGDAMLTSSSEGIAQHYTLPRIAIANVVLDPSLSVAA